MTSPENPSASRARKKPHVRFVGALATHNRPGAEGPAADDTRGKKDIVNKARYSGSKVLERELAADIDKHKKADPEGKNPQSPLEEMKVTRKRLVTRELELKRAINSSPDAIRQQRVAEATRSIESNEKEIQRLTKALDTTVLGREAKAEDAQEVLQKKKEQIAALEAALAKRTELDEKKAAAEGFQMTDLHTELAEVQNALDYSDISDGMRDSRTDRLRLLGVYKDAPLPPDVPTGKAEQILASDKVRKYEGAAYFDEKKKIIGKGTKEVPVKYKPEGNLISKEKLVVKGPLRQEVQRAESISSGTTPREGDAAVAAAGMPDERAKVQERNLNAAFKGLVEGKADKNEFNKVLNDVADELEKIYGLDDTKKEGKRELMGRLATAYIGALVAATLPTAGPELSQIMREILGKAFKDKYNRSSLDWKHFSEFTRELPHLAHHISMVAQHPGFNPANVGAPREWKELRYLHDSQQVDQKMVLFVERTKSLAKSVARFPVFLKRN